MLLNFDDLDPSSELYATNVVDRLLQKAIEAGASDVHVEKTQDAIQLRWRVDGCLMDLGGVSEGKSTSVLGRIKALARLITYRYDIPQEGRMTLRESNLTENNLTENNLEARVGTLPTLHGERAVIRLTNRKSLQWLPEELGLEDTALDRLQQTLKLASGVILITGPAGAGKTTTAYACMRYLQQAKTLRSLVTLEDPIESALPGVSQSQINPSAGYSWSDGLKALLRQDPEVMLVGEIRDAETASVVFQAAMTGQLVLSTMHARSASDALRRLLDMHIPVHHLRSALDYLICQRLVRRPDSAGEYLGTRSLVTELLPTIEGALADSIQTGASTMEIQRAAQELGMQVLGSDTGFA